MPRIHTFIATSDIHIERKLQTTREDVKGQARAAVAHAREYTDDVEFSPEDGSRSDVEFMAEVVQIALDEGATTINVPDTVGYTMPDEYAAMFARALPSSCPGCATSRCRCTATTTWAWPWPTPSRASSAGCRQVECAINGIGERAGNASLEEIVMLLHTRESSVGLWTGVDTREIARSSRLVSRLTGYHGAAQQGDRGPQRLRARGRASTRTACSRSAPPTRSWTPPRSASSQNSIVLGKHSGRHALRKALEELGFEVEGAALNRPSSASRRSPTRRRRSRRSTSRRSSPTR